ncbi:MAG: hypothetical protein CSA26_06095 [Desulfobacterales bacterium]|nr:MAG: hypothetical protein CSA26_06095 [Desulfobacterales bacterium]
MTEKKKERLPSLDEVVRQIDKSLLDIDDSQALKLGLTTIAGTGARARGERYLLFSVGGVAMTVSLEGVVEVVDLTSITELPYIPAWVLGITNVRGEIVSVLDLPLYLGWKTETPVIGTHLVILENRNMKTGIRIDQVLGTVYRDKENTPTAVTDLPDNKAVELLPARDGRNYLSIDYRILLEDERFLTISP